MNWKIKLFCVITGIILGVTLPLIWVFEGLRANPYIKNPPTLVDAASRLVGLRYMDKVYELNRDVILEKYSDTGVARLKHDYRDVIRRDDIKTYGKELVPVTLPKGTRFVVKDVKIIKLIGDKEKKMPIIYGQFSKDIEEDLVDVSYIFGFDDVYFTYLGNAKKDWDLLISECVKPDPKLMREIIYPQS